MSYDKHQNLPALNRYTSSTQYEALCKIRETKSIVPIVFAGGSSRTLGALVRSAWIKSETYTDDQGVTREGWFVTPEGEHAMKLYEIKKAEEDKQKAEAKRAEAHLTELAKEYCVVRDRYEFFKFLTDVESSRLDKLNALFRTEPRVCTGTKNVISNWARNEYRRKTVTEHVRELATAHGFDLPEVVDLEQPNS